jgi:hypothetical protein
MIRMHVRTHHVIDFVWRDTDGLESRQERVEFHHVPESPLQTRTVVANTSVHQNGVTAGLHQERLNRQ